MSWDHFETDGELRGARREALEISAASTLTSAPRHAPRGFTLTELLVVITIIAVLASLVTGAVMNALSRAKQAAITLEIQQIAMGLEDLKNEYGAYPPNVYSNASTLGTNPEKIANAQTLLRMMRKAFPRGTEFAIDLSGASPARNATASNDNIFPIAETGLSPAEALVFWLQGFSSDVSRPFTGTDLELFSIDDNGTTINNVITIDSFTPRYDFDRNRLRISRNAAGVRRFISVERTIAPFTVQIQLYEYLAPSSEEPYVYFDTSRDTPLEVVNNWETTEFFYSSPNSGGFMAPLKRVRLNAPDPGDWVTPTLQYYDYVNEGKFQVLHCGLDDAWGDLSLGGSLNESNGTLTTNVDFELGLLFPTGPFIGDLADTVGNFGTGALEDAQE